MSRNSFSSFYENTAYQHFIVPFDVELDDELLINTDNLFISDEIGSGGASTVYQGWYDDDEVAIKFIQNYSRNNEEKENLENNITNEINIMYRMKHKNVTELIGASVRPGAITIVMELLKNGSLTDYFDHLNEIDEHLHLTKSIKFALDVSTTMEYLHKGGIIHLDLKSENLLLSDDKTTLKLADFGLAQDSSKVNEITAGKGTYKYMAPELFNREGKKYCSNKYDIYSFSIIFWELLTTKRVYDDEDISWVKNYVLNEEGRPSLECIPVQVIPLLERCWATEPDNRPEFTEIIEVLSDLV
ncbi:serine/threonine-protein kinase STY8-like isoform X1 [Macadamia integrifolia]|uniref:serine/threonine-protein kinase STY8-like isoform X1 n=1 Tax=Macadamia integrifolia TaxID=60698 RepID=UPI001C4F3B50|nr:serine/threonine-protein kinase STY8-like isoform X1 [Macadamia integrifolia]